MNETRDLPLFPDQASTAAPQVDLLYGWVVGLAVFFTVLVATLLILFAVRYRRQSEEEIPAPIHGSVPLEIVWTLVPLVLALITFFWGARVYFTLSRPPDDAMDIYVVGKQWMWKLQHVEGAREINELHVPVGRPVRLTMTTEDVIHSFYVPAFRIKADVVPGRYTTTWFEATKTGRYHLFCAEYCGTKHSGMIGWVHVMEARDYQEWLSGGAAQGSMAARGEKLFTELACNTCHQAGPTQRGPSLAGLAGKPVTLKDGSRVTADDNYIRESILNPAGRVVAGYDPIMPLYQGLVSEEGLLALMTYIKSLPAAAADSVGYGSVTPVSPETRRERNP